MTEERELREEVAEILGVSPDAAEKVVAACEPLWCALEEYGLVDSFGGAESERVIPVALDAIMRAANPLRYEEA